MAATQCLKVDEQPRTSSGISHVFSSSYLGRLFKNPFAVSSVASFKMRLNRNRSDLYALPDRPVTGPACSNCFYSTTDDTCELPGRGTGQDPQRKASKASRVFDVLALPSAAYKASFSFLRRISDILYCLQTVVSYTYSSVDAIVLASQRVKDGIAKSVSRDVDEDEATIKQMPDGEFPGEERHRQYRRTEIVAAGERVRARATLRQMRAHISSWVQRVVGYVLFKLLRPILRTVQVCPAQMEKLKEAAADGIPMVYLPNHRSHLDYVLLSFTLAQFQLRTPYVAAGDNLNIPGFAWLLRSLGAFFIRRRMDKDYVYRAVLHSYIEELLKKGESLEFFIEAGRSRTGRLILPKAGLLSVVVGAHLQGIMNNAYIVPVSVSYEKLMEGSFSTELMGEPKKKETFWAAVCGIWNVFSTKYGSVRIDFGQPVTIQDYLNSLRSRLPPLPPLPSASAVDVSRQVEQFRSKSLSSRNSLLSLCSGIELNQVTDENRRLIKALSHHIAYDFSQNSALMCTQMLAFLLTTKYRHGGRLDDIVDDFHWLCCRVITNGRDIGFSGDPRDVVRYAIELLGSELVTAEISDIDSGVVSDSGCGMGWNANGNGGRADKDVTESHLWIVKPTNTLPRIHDLAYYAAPVSTVFLQEAVIANALLATSQETIRSSNAAFGQVDSPVSTESKIDWAIPSSKIIDRALAITDLLQHEFLFAKPCLSLRQCLEKTLERMVQEGLLVRRTCPSTTTTSTSSTWSVRFCLDRNQILDPPTYSSTSSRRSSTSTSFGPIEDDMNVVTDKRRRKAHADGTFYMASEDEEMADYEDEVDDEEDELFEKPCPTPTTGCRRSSYGIASLVDSEDDYNADVIRLYASILAPILEAYKFAFKSVLAALAQPASTESLTRTQWKTESELLQSLLAEAKEHVRENTCQYAEFVSIEPMRNAIKWLVSKGVLVSLHDRLRLHEAYVDDRETLDRFCTEINDLCVVVTY